MAALQGVRVGALPGPFVPAALATRYAARLLADLGAQVWVVPAGGDEPLPRLREYLGAGTTIADGAAAEVVAGADVVVEGLGPGGLEDLGLRPAGPAVRISAFGQDGPRATEPVSELTLQAAGAWVSNHGIPGLDPVRVGGRAPGWVGGAYAAASALTALRIGGPVVVDLSLQACLVGTLPSPMLFQFTLDRLGQVLAERRYVVPGIVPCGDGWVGINCLTGQHWLDLCALLEVPDWEKRQRDVIEQDAAYQGFVEAARSWLDGRTAAEVVTICQALRIPAAPIGDGRSLPGLAQFAERGFYRPLPGGDVAVPGPPYRLAATPAEPGAPARAGAPPPAREARPANEDLPFAGLRVVDLSIFWSGPYLTQYLASLGADVVKVESIQRPDGFRYSASFPELGQDWYERSLVWQATNLSKRDLTLDLGRPEGRDLLWRLVEGADVLVENFSPRVADSFGLTDEAVRAANPGVVYVRMPGFGLAGPWRDHVGWAMVFEQACGLAQVTGFEDGPPLNPGGFADPVVGMHAATAVQAALAHRERTGEGQLVEVAQIEVMAAITAEQVLEAAATGQVPGRTGNQGDEALLDAVVLARDGWLAVSLRDEADVAVAAEVTGDVELADWASVRGADEAAAALVAAGVAASAVLGVPGMLTEPQLTARGYYQELDHPLTGAVPYPGWPMRFSAAVLRHHRHGAPTLGQHNDEILGGELGLSGEELQVLREAGVIGEALRRR